MVDIDITTTFLGNTDTPDTYVGQAGKPVVVNQDETALVFGENNPDSPEQSLTVLLMTAGNLSFNPVYDNGVDGVGATLTATANGILRDTTGSAKIDSVTTPQVGEIIWVKDRTNAIENGAYEITDRGSVSSTYILTRPESYNEMPELYPLQINVLYGNVNKNTVWLQKTIDPVIGVDPIIISKINATNPISDIRFIDTATSEPLPPYTFNPTTNIMTFDSVGYFGSLNGCDATLNANLPNGCRTFLAKDEADPTRNGTYKWINVGSSVVAPSAFRLDSLVSEFSKNSRIFIVSNSNSTLYGKQYCVEPTTPPLTNANLNTVPLNFIEITDNNKQDLLISGTNIKTVGGNSILGSGNIPISVPSGIFGISNSSGVYTYYATLTLAMTAATSGQVIEQFANVIETGNVEITLKNNVTWNGNGYSYTLSRTGTIHALKTTGSVVTNFNFYNTNVIRTGSTDTLFDNAALSLGTSGSGSIRCFGANFTNNGSGVGLVVATSSTAFVQGANAFATTTYGAIGIFTSAGASFAYCTGTGTSGGYGIRCHSGGNTEYCLGISDSGVGFFGDAGTHSFCKGISVSGNGFVSGSSSYSCIGISTSGIGFNATNGFNVDKCTGISTSGVGFFSNIKSYNCTGISSSNKGVQLGFNAIAYNITSKSTTNSSLLAINGCKIIGGTIISEWNNAAGYGIQGNGGVFPAEIRGVKFQLANSSAPYFYNNGTAATVITVDNQYQGGGAYNVNITQGTVSVQDTQGNIFL